MTVAAAAPPGALAIDGLTYAVSVAALLSLAIAHRATSAATRVTAGAEQSAAKLWPQIVEGWRYVRGQPTLNAVMWTGAAYNLGSAMYDAILVLVGVQTPHYRFEWEREWRVPRRLDLCVGHPALLFVLTAEQAQVVPDLTARGVARTPHGIAPLLDPTWAEPALQADLAQHGL